MDIANSLAPRSDQINADDLVAGPITYTIREVVGGTAEQPFDFLLIETDRAYRPAVTMRRLIAAAWGTNGDQYVGRRLTLYRDPTIRFGKDVVGGIRISHMSHIDKRIEVKLQVTRGKRESFAVDPLPELSRVEQLKVEWRAAGPERRAEIEAEVNALSTNQPDADSTAADALPEGGE